VPTTFACLGLWQDGPVDVCKKLSLQHAENMYLAEDDVVRQQYSLDMDTITSEDVVKLRASMEADRSSFVGWTENKHIHVPSLPADSLLSVVSKK
jgi:hypothetical protein